LISAGAALAAVAVSLQIETLRVIAGFFDMHEYQTFVYLAVQKTGTTFIAAMLDRFSREKAIRSDSHIPMGADYDPKKFYFISVRDPLDAYLSLYSYGSEARGKMRNKLEAQGINDLYDGTMGGFNEWLMYVMKPKNAEALDRSYAKMGDGAIAKLVGYQSWRYLRLALPNPIGTLAKCESEDEIRALYKEKRLPTYIVRYEHFIPDLVALVRGPLSHAITDIDAAVDFIENTLPINTSERVDALEDGVTLNRRLSRRLAEREWFLSEQFGY
jgi:hypothetical protein